MAEQTLKDFKKIFLLEFTRELIRNSIDIEMYKLRLKIKDREEREIKGIKSELRKGKEEIRAEKRAFKTFIQRKTERREEGYIPSLKSEKDEESPFAIVNYKGIIKKDFSSKEPFFIPDFALPERLQYLKPLPTREEIDLGKINNLIQDPVIREIECNGPNQEIIIKGVIGTKETNIVLTNEEINNIIKKFSAETKIPLQEGFFKAAYGRFILRAIYSESLDSKFIIKKILLPPPRQEFAINR